MQRRRFSTLLAISVSTFIYIVVGRFSLELASLHKSASPVWPPAGIALALLLTLGYWMWPAIFLGAFVVNLINPPSAGSVLPCLGIATGNLLEAVCGAWLINRFAGGTRVFDRPQGVFKFALATIVSALVSASFGVTSLALARLADWANYGVIWSTWWLGDAAGALVVAPLLLLWSIKSGREWKRREIIEVGFLLLLLFLLAQLVFGGWISLSLRNYPISFICGPIVIWTAFRFTQRETATGIFILSAIAIWGTLRGFGPFIMGTENQSLLTLQAWTAVLTVTALALSSGMVERRSIEKILQQQKSVVEAANHTKDNFIAMLSHELRTPLTPVITALDTLESGPASMEESRSALAMIRRNVELESQLIDDLLDLTRIAKDKLRLSFEVIDAHRAISNVVEICRPEVTLKSLRLRLNLHAGAHHISGDAAKFQQIIWNLLKNAIKFTPENGEIAILSANPAPQVLNIAVRDSGVGIEPDWMERIFDPFEQGNRSVERGFGGLGLGLAISKSLAEAHGGSLVACSDGRNQGSTFTLTMQTVAPRPEVSVPAGANDALEQRRVLRILLVDDHKDTCDALERLLVRRGHFVSAAHNVKSALETAAHGRFDLLISDVSLPDGSGIDLMMQLRAVSAIPGIAISGFGNNGDIQRSLQAGFSGHLVKPIKVEKLETAIAHALQGTAVS
jgi:signal transduction histidine kinase/ActR/RegA family two-component response regulator